ncbi:MAG TPA: HAD family hydrolase [Ktedonobacterales bacterium]
MSVVSRAPCGVRSILFDLGSTLWERQDERVLKRNKREAEACAVALVQSLLATGAAVALWEGAFAAVAEASWGRELRARALRATDAAFQARPQREPDFVALHLDALRALGIHTDDARWGAMLYEALRIRSAPTRALFPDALPTLETLRRRGYALGIVTNRAYGGAVFVDDLRQMGLLDYFPLERIAVSADLRVRKPHPMIFRYALEGVATDARETAMVGNDLYADVVGARQLGLFSVWKREEGAPAAPPDGPDTPDAVITRLEELLALFP